MEGGIDAHRRVERPLQVGEEGAAALEAFIEDNGQAKHRLVGVHREVGLGTRTIAHQEGVVHAITRGSFARFVALKLGGGAVAIALSLVWGRSRVLHAAFVSVLVLAGAANAAREIHAKTAPRAFIYDARILPVSEFYSEYRDAPLGDCERLLARS